MSRAPRSADQRLFVPSCPHCRYNLSGLPDGRCPECGNPFALDDLRRRRKTPWWRLAWPGVLPTLAWFVVALWLNEHTHHQHFGLVVLIWVSMSLAWVFRKEFSRGFWTPLLFSVAVAAACTYATSRLPPRWMGPVGLELVAVHLAAFLFAGIVGWVMLRSRRASSIVAAIGGLLAGAGATVLLLALAGMEAGETWSVWPDLRWWQPYRNYPFLNSEAAWVGGMTTVIGLVPLTIGAKAHFTQRRPVKNGA